MPTADEIEVRTLHALARQVLLDAGQAGPVRPSSQATRPVVPEGKRIVATAYGSDREVDRIVM